ncbi:EF-hand domain-containing protein [Polaromonas sp. SM01]|uniref:EF-hand domain-containing protein n=1 Tax=Polaromonas sp. SM01 TaxID=3085630 RepID=UPI002981F042|nr:EF-hand domain-containing protein [Polaromonas sp. SM01]MDW5442671.1 EF-hand domain-containing protein [Polaromonas sp. SM01]
MTLTVAHLSPSRLTKPYRALGGLLLALTVFVLAMNVHAQPQAEQPAQAASQAQAATPAVPVVAAEPKYAAKDVERAFGFIDANRDGKISREEAAGFRGVAKHFDEADLNKDGFLSRDEFGNALNRGKSH